MKLDPRLSDPSSRGAEMQRFSADLSKALQDTSRDKIEQHRQLSNSWLSYFSIALIPGAAMTLTGFPLWYFRVQRPQDRLLAAQQAKERAKERDGKETHPSTSRLTKRNRRRW